MSTMSLRLPASLHRPLREFVKKDDRSINQLIATMVAEKMATLSTLEYPEAMPSAAAGRSLRWRYRAFRMSNLKTEILPGYCPTTGSSRRRPASAALRRRTRCR